MSEEVLKCDLNEGDIVRLRVPEGVYTTFNKIPDEKLNESDWRPRGPKMRAGSTCLIIDTGSLQSEYWVKVVIPGEGQGWIRRSYVQVIE